MMLRRQQNSYDVQILRTFAHCNCSGPRAVRWQRRDWGGGHFGKVALNLTPEFVRLKHGEIAVETRLLRAHDLQARTLHLW
jgi:hypothetical protein